MPPLITFRRNASRLARRSAALAAPFLFVALLGGTAGCMTQNDLVKLPTLHDVEPTGPEGKKCYDRCSHVEATCRHMCPKFGQLCFDDCVMDTKFCLYDCPQLRRPGEQ
jgi:hypothetical protein